MNQVEKELIVSFRAAVALDAIVEMLDIMTDLSDLYINRMNDLQTGADMLAYVIQHPDVADDTHERATDLFEELETYACPRVIHDAKQFARYVNDKEIISFVIADGYPPEL